MIDNKLRSASSSPSTCSPPRPALRLVQVWQDFHQVRLSVERLGDILNTPVEPEAVSAQVDHVQIAGAIA